MSRSMTSAAPLAVAADYADALMTARRAKNILFLIVAVLLIAQIAIFMLARFDVLKLSDEVAVTTNAATQPVSTDAATTPPATETKAAMNVGEIIRYATPVINFAAVALSIVLTISILLLVTIMLVGRLIGVSHVTSSFFWAVFFIALIVPWQTLFIADEHYAVAGGSASVTEQPAFKWPGALYTWAELKRDYKFANEPVINAVWMWGRYAALPALALLVLFLIQLRSGRGLRLALGEAEVHIEVTNRTDTIVQN